jgi:hypothetical protein
MKQVTMQNDTSSNVFLTGAILFANMDYAGLADYGIKATIGGLVWMLFKLGTDYLSEKIKNKNR